MDRFEQKSLKQMTIQGYFVFASKRHAVEKLDYDRISKSKIKQWRVARRIAKLVAQNFQNVDAVVSVAEGANGLAGSVARRTSKLLNKHVEGWQTRKRDSGFELNPSSIYSADKNWVIIDDVFTKGTNTLKVAETLHKWGGRVVGVCTFVNRNAEGLREIPYPQVGRIACAERHPDPSLTESRIPVSSVIQYPMEDFAAEDCPARPDCVAV